MSAVRAARPAMATPILPSPPPRIKPGTWSLSLGALLATLLLAAGICAAGITLARHAPQPPTSNAANSAATAIPPEMAHAAVAVGKAAAAPITDSPQAVALASGTIQGIDRQTGALRLLIDGVGYAFYIGQDTSFPDRCLQPDDLRSGMQVTLSLPWYMGGQLWARAVGPRFGCNPDGSPRLVREAPASDDAPPAPGTPRRTAAAPPAAAHAQHRRFAVPGMPLRSVPAPPSRAPAYPPRYFDDAGQPGPSGPTPAPTVSLPASPPQNVRMHPRGSAGRMPATLATPRLPLRLRGLGGW